MHLWRLSRIFMRWVRSKPKIVWPGQPLQGHSKVLSKMSIRPLSPILAEKARRELNENISTVEAELKTLKDWIFKQPHLRIRKDDQWLLGFLRGSKHSLEKAKNKIDLFYTLRNTASDIVKRMKVSDPKFDEILSLGAAMIVPESKDEASPRLIIFRMGVYDANQFNVKDIMFVYFILQLILLWEDDQAVVCGTDTVLDLENVTLNHFFQMTPSLMTKLASLAQDAMPFRLKSIHFINTPPGFETIFNFMKTILNVKNRNRLFVHNKDYEALYKTIPKESLPQEYGGNSGTISDILNIWKTKLTSYRSWLEEEEQYGSDENRQVHVPQSADESSFSIDGSFRQLQID